MEKREYRVSGIHRVMSCIEKRTIERERYFSSNGVRIKINNQIINKFLPYAPRLSSYEYH